MAQTYLAETVPHDIGWCPGPLCLMQASANETLFLQLLEDPRS